MVTFNVSQFASCSQKDISDLIAKKAYDLYVKNGCCCVGAVLIGGPIIVYRHTYNGAYNKGWKDGYAKSLKDNSPMVITGGTTTINNDGKDKEPFFLLKIWNIRLLV